MREPRRLRVLESAARAAVGAGAALAAPVATEEPVPVESRHRVTASARHPRGVA